MKTQVSGYLRPGAIELKDQKVGDMMSKVYWKRIYEPSDTEDGYRILIDRLWPRGLTKERAAVDHWSKPISPSTPLRQAYHQGLIDYDTFARKYKQELTDNSYYQEFITLIKDHLKVGNVTLMYSNKEPEFTHVSVLQTYIEKISGIKSFYIKSSES